jgi:diazepam-binding inhibitor (GABA receptor modulating acyl-CoA-binding protein)
MSESFQKAVEDSKKLTSKPGPDELLELYGKDLLVTNLRFSANRDSPALYKVANGEDFKAATQPGMFDLKASSIPLAFHHATTGLTPS